MPIVTTDLSYTYAPSTAFETRALDNVSLEIGDGEYVGIMGRTGCGKSTLIQLLAGLITPTAGAVFIDGEDINAPSYDRAELRKKVGVLFQYPECQLFETTVEKDVAFGLKHSGLSKDAVARNVRWALEREGFDFEKVRGLSPLGLSGGEKRRVATAGILAAKPEILILDEPIAGLDPLGRDTFLQLTEDLNREGVTILMISHNADALAEHARRLLVLESGRILLDGPPKEVFRNADLLRGLNIGVSQAKYAAELLRSRGVGLPPDIVTEKELLTALTGALKGGAQ